jgi:DNA-directed RNA polymerase subunit RPC12/RpoP
MEQCVKCRKPVITGEYVLVDSKPVCMACMTKLSSKDDSVEKNIKCPLCHKRMEIGKVGVKVPFWSVLRFWVDWAAYPYWYDSNEKINFSKNQIAYVCKKCRVMTVI